jgi:pimeloyl-ACP methyl ester carboxylesterase
VNLDGVGPVDVRVSEYGEGRPFLLLHGGGGPDTVARFGDTLADAKDARVLIPTHPGFGGTLRPEALHSVRGLAALYVALLDFFSLGMDQVFELSFHNPAPFRIDPATLSPAAQAIAAGNRAALAAYAGTAMTDPTLEGRLHDVAVPTLVVWGDSDRMVDPAPASCLRRSADAGSRGGAQRCSSSQRASLGQTLTASRASVIREPGTLLAPMMG